MDLPDTLRLAIEGDCHFKTTNLPERRLVKNEVMGFLQSRKVDGVVLLGDILHTFGKFSVDPYKEAVEYIEGIAKTHPIIILIGNHDRKNNREFCNSVHAFVALKGKHNILIVDKPRLVEMKGKKVLALPYVWKEDFGRLLELPTREHTSTGQKLRTTRKKVIEWIPHVDVVFAHQDYAGRREGGMVKDDGWRWAIEWPLVISGHVHIYHYVQENVCYLGTLLQENFGEDTDKALGYLTIPNDGKWTLERVRLKIPLKKTLTMTIQDLYSLDISSLNEEFVKYKIKATGTTAEKKGLAKSGILEKLEAAEITLDIDEVVEKRGDFILKERPTPETFNRILYEKALADPRKLHWFRVLYGRNAVPEVKIKIKKVEREV